MELAHLPLARGPVRLDPLAPAHRAALRVACDADPDIWAELYPYSMAGAHFDGWWERTQAARAAGTRLPYAVLLHGACVGVTHYLAPDAANAAVEIGGTYHAPAARGGPANPAAKLLLLDHAFTAGARRVAFKVDARNARSRAAMAKLGATEEGTLRQDRVVWTGRVRDTVVFSILADEWPLLAARLRARLAGLPGGG